MPVGREDASLDDYLAHLRVLGPWMVQMRLALAEARVPALAAVAARIDDRSRALALDLGLEDAGAGLRVDASECRRFPLPACEPQAFAWGLAYVVEGSQLGGAVMYRRLSTRLAPHPLRYFAPVAGATTGAAWTAFVAALGAAVRSRPAIESAADGAAAAFEHLLAGFALDAA
ncbi:heme oxygenase [Variovorax sp. J22P168]|uniref:biliverdin-producing heme oxygenase n=1 Tax=Variovorax jilinensis TaxID=3053513 RepID=UPI00257840A5|nr:biliverdin-producing heme oxygenase [Variovorax sp. J22P168]MDM0014580.1 heme oxygenase [Variovorax sp. J22P168]